MDTVLLATRVMLALMFIGGGLMFHLGQRRLATEAARGFGVPLATIGVPLTGVLMVLGGLMVVLGVWGDVGALVLAVNVALFAFFMHAPWKADEDVRDEQTQHFLKNLTICGGLVLLFWTFNQLGSAAPLTLTDPLLRPF